MEPEIQEISLFVSQSSAETVVSVDDLLLEILLWLPMKSLIRFKSVSKRWQSLISDPGFVIRRNPNPNPATGLILEVPTKFGIRPDPCAPYAYVVSLDETTTTPQIRTLKKCGTDDTWANYDATDIKSCCNGLILMCRSYKLDNKYHPERYDYYVCNPTTNKYSMLPQIPDDSDWMLQMCLAFDPSKSPHYKVVCVTRSLEKEPEHGRWIYRYKFLVYSSETGCWRKSCVEPLVLHASADFEGGAYWNGAVHWVNYRNNGKSIYFDPEEDGMSLEKMPTPPNLLNNSPNIGYYYHFFFFGESCGHLHYIENCKSLMMDVYELRSDYSEWFVKFRIRDPSFSVGHMHYLCAVVRGKSDDDDSFAVLLIEGKFVRYDFVNKTRETICQVRVSGLEQCFKNESLYSPTLQLQYSESLCSV